MPDSIPGLSDHAYVSREFEMYSPTDCAKMLTITVGSWNLQDKCFSKESHRGQLKFANNPYNADETPENYRKRKLEQFAKIRDNINAKDGDDVVLMQEIDCFLYHPDLKKAFEDMIHPLGYKLVLTQMPPPPLSQQPMALIYNSNKLDFQESKPLFPSPPGFGKPKYRAYESIFKDKNGLSISFVNLHLLYGLNYNAAIDEHLTFTSNSGILSIMGGDTNSPPDSSIKSSLRDEEIATNFSHDPIKNRLTTSHELPGSPQTLVPKAYDRFFAAAPPEYALHTQITKRSEQVFIDTEGSAIFCSALLLPESSFDERRHCFFKGVSPTEFPGVKTLEFFLQRVNQCVSADELDSETKQIKAMPEYQELITDQTTEAFDPARLFEQKCEEKRRSFTDHGAAISLSPQ